MLLKLYLLELETAEVRRKLVVTAGGKKEGAMRLDRTRLVKLWFAAFARQP